MFIVRLRERIGIAAVQNIDFYNIPQRFFPLNGEVYDEVDMWGVE